MTSTLEGGLDSLFCYTISSTNSLVIICIIAFAHYWDPSWVIYGMQYGVSTNGNSVTKL